MNEIVRLTAIFFFFIPTVNLSPILVATMIFMARRSVPLNKAPVFIERKDISLSNYSAEGVSAEEKKRERERKGICRFATLSNLPPSAQWYRAYGARGYVRRP